MPSVRLIVAVLAAMAVIVAGVCQLCEAAAVAPPLADVLAGIASGGSYAATALAYKSGEGKCNYNMIGTAGWTPQEPAWHTGQLIEGEAVCAKPCRCCPPSINGLLSCNSWSGASWLHFLFVKTPFPLSADLQYPIRLQAWFTHITQQVS